jgi:hypothetical protein
MVMEEEGTFLVAPGRMDELLSDDEGTHLPLTPPLRIAQFCLTAVSV